MAVSDATSAAVSRAPLALCMPNTAFSTSFW
jgi:hypothetical protein